MTSQQKRLKSPIRWLHTFVGTKKSLKIIRELTDKIFCNIYGIRFQMYYKMRILPVIFLFSMMTKAQDNFILGFLIHGVNLILNKGMTGIWIARRYWLFFYIEEPIYPSVYHVVWGGGKTISYNLLFSLLIRQHSQIHSLALR